MEPRGSRCRRGDPSAKAGHGGGDDVSHLEDETGLVNVICSPGCWTRYRKAARSAVVLLVTWAARAGRGGRPNRSVVLERSGGVPGGDRPRDGG